VPLTRLKATVKSYDLGYLRLWRDDLAEIVRLVRQLDAKRVEIHADACRLDDVETDLPDPRLGPRLSDFSVIATTVAGNDTSRELISVRLSRRGSRIEVTDPDLTTTGLTNELRSVVASCRWIPLWWPDFGFGANNGAGPITGLVGFFAFLFGLLNLTFRKSAQPVPTYGVIAAVVGAVMLIAAIIGAANSRTILLTNTRSEAPTWWQQYRAHIVIGVVIAAVFYLLGVLTTHP
jgi:hypothetical protein